MTAAVSNSPRRAYWLKTLHQWHWISSAICLLGMLLFSITGITLNHAAQIGAAPKVIQRQAQLPAALQAAAASQVNSEEAKSAELPAKLKTWLEQNFSVRLAGRDIERSPEEIYISLPRPGGDAWLRVDTATGNVEYESTERGWISYFNDLHKGRHTGLAWSWFIDLFAVACLIFSITGLFILKLHAGNRPSTWPLVGLGIVIPLLLAILFIH